MVEFFDAPFNEKEIKKVIFSCDLNKAPGPDDFSFQFYQSFWNLVSMDIFELVNTFFLSN
jgi:hypothetical protein